MFYKVYRGIYVFDKIFLVVMVEYGIFIKCELRIDFYLVMMIGKSWLINKYWWFFVNGEFIKR